MFQIINYLFILFHTICENSMGLSCSVLRTILKYGLIKIINMMIGFVNESFCFCKFHLYLSRVAEKPKLHLDGLYGKMIRVRAGDPVYINIPMTGSPLPTVRWVFNKQHLQDTPRSRQEVLEDLIKLTFPKTERSDSGVYTIEVKNPYGEDSADITLFVYGKSFNVVLQFVIL